MIERFSVDLGSRAVFFPRITTQRCSLCDIVITCHHSAVCLGAQDCTMWQLNPWIRFLILHLVEGLTLRRENISVSNAGQSRVPCGFQYANGAIPVKYPMNFPWICAWISLFLMANILLQWWVKTWHPGDPGLKWRVPEPSFYLAWRSWWSWSTFWEIIFADRHG